MLLKLKVIKTVHKKDNDNVRNNSLWNIINVNINHYKNQLKLLSQYINQLIFCLVPMLLKYHKKHSFHLSPFLVRNEKCCPSFPFPEDNFVATYINNHNVAHRNIYAYMSDVGSFFSVGQAISLKWRRPILCLCGFNLVDDSTGTSF